MLSPPVFVITFMTILKFVLSFGISNVSDIKAHWFDIEVLNVFRFCTTYPLIIAGYGLI
jgi:hypothetical protein